MYCMCDATGVLAPGEVAGVGVEGVGGRLLRKKALAQPSVPPEDADI
jgi:hypothetical protein